MCRRAAAGRVVDLATLTGSIVSALGNEAAGLFANDDALAARMLDAASAAGEPLWRMPILAGHRAQLKSERADRKQCADRWGDCAIAAAFLEAYVDKRPWLHLDIAGVAYNEGSPEWPAYHPRTAPPAPASERCCASSLVLTGVARSARDGAPRGLRQLQVAATHLLAAAQAATRVADASRATRLRAARSDGNATPDGERA